MKRLAGALIGALSTVLVVTSSPATAAPADHAVADFAAAKAALHRDHSLVETRRADGSVAFRARSGVVIVAGPTTPRSGGSPQVSSGGCGFLQLCVYFNRTEQKYIGVASIAAIVALICAASVGVACGVASVIAAVASQYVSGHGLCPSSRPRLRVRVLPTVGGATCV